MTIKIKNETLKKLTNEEALDLGLTSIGCMFIRGDLKQRTNGYKTTLKLDDEVHYENDNIRVEFIALTSKSEYDGKMMQDWCARIYDKNKNEYDNLLQPLFFIGFVR